MQKRRECQRQGATGEAVALYCDPLATPDLASSGFPGRVKKGESYHYALDYRFGELQNIGPNHAFCLLFLMVTIIFAFFYAMLGLLAFDHSQQGPITINIVVLERRSHVNDDGAGQDSGGGDMDLTKKLSQ